jgi:hypothetical protein
MAAATSQTYKPMISNAHGPARMTSTSRHALMVIVFGARNHAAASLFDGTSTDTSTPIADSASTETVTPTNTL